MRGGVVSMRCLVLGWQVFNLTASVSQALKKAKCCPERGRQIRNPVPFLCFLLLFIAFQLRIAHQRPLCTRSLTDCMVWTPQP